MNYKPDSDRMLKALRHLYECGVGGSTWFELAERYGWHHGQASAVLSTLHREQRIARLTERRGRSLVYVDKMFINDRPTTPYGRAVRATYDSDEVNAYIDSALDEAARQVYGMAHITKPKGLIAHYSGCWRDHVSCALVTAARQVEARKSDVPKKRAS